MSFPDITYTSEIRAILGVSERELRDDVLISQVFSTRLTEDLYELDADLLDNYKIAFDASPRTALQERFVHVLQAFASYKMASYLLGSLDMFAPEVIQEARSKLQRSSDAEREVAQSVNASLPILLARLRAVYAQVKPGYSAPALSTRLPGLSVAALGTDPVTG